MDTAVGEFGRALDGELKAIEAKNRKELQVKTQRVLAKWLDDEIRYRDPVKSGHVQLPSRGGDS